MVAVCRSSRRDCHVPVGCHLFPAPVDPHTTARTLQLWLKMVGDRLYFAIIQHNTQFEALMSMVATDESKGWEVGKSDRGSDLKDARHGSSNQKPPYKVSRRQSI
jgi:hypothetical protein